MRTILQKYMLPLHKAENESGAAEVTSSPADTGAGADESSISSQDESSTTEAEASADVSSSSDDASASHSAKADKGETSDWKDKRLAKLTAQLHEERRKAAELASKVAKPEANANPNPNVEFDRLVNERAAQQRQAEDFARRCTDEALAGREKYGEQEFNKALGDLQRLIDASNNEDVAKYTRFLQASMEAGNAKDIIFALGNDLSKADRIFEMNDIKMAVELAKMAEGFGKEAPAEAVSSAPKPITPVGGRSGDRNPIDPTSARGDELSTAEWMRRRNAQVAQRGAR